MSGHDPSPPSGDVEPVLTIIRNIKERSLDPRGLSAEDRRRCVEVLRAEGYSMAEIAQVLKRHERTIHRDLEQIRAAHALAPDPSLCEQMIGEMVRQAETSVSRLRKIAREPGASAMERLMAESAAWKVYREMFEKLQSVGYLPRMPTNVVADVYQHLDADPTAIYDELGERLRELEQVDRELGLDNPARTARLAALEDEVQRGRMSARIEQLGKEPPERDRGCDHEAN